MFFNENGYGYSEDIDHAMQDLALIDTSESFEPDFEGAMNLVAESEAAYNKIMEGVAIDELRYYAETGQQMPVTEGSLSDFFTKVGNFFKKLWLKIKQIFAKFMSFMDQWVRTNKSFVSKYEKMSLPATVKFSGFEYTHMDWKPGSEDADRFVKGCKLDKLPDANTIKQCVETINDVNKDDVRGALLDQGPISSSNFSDAIYKYFRHTVATKGTKTYKVSEQFTYISNYNAEKKAANAAMKEFENSFKETLNDLKSLEKDINNLEAKDDASREEKSLASTFVSKMTGFTKDYKSFQVAINGGFLKALKERKNQAKAIVVKAAKEQYDANYKANKAQYEGANYGGGFLSNVTLV